MPASISILIVRDVANAETGRFLVLYPIEEICMKSPSSFFSMQNCPFVSVMHTATMAESGSERSETVANSIGCPFSSVTNPIRFCALSWQIVTNKIIIVVVALFIIDK